MFKDEFGWVSTSNDPVLGSSTNPDQAVVAAVICENALLRAGLKHLLSGTSFTVSDSKSDLNSPSSHAGLGPDLLIVEANEFPEKTLTFVQDAKSQSPAPRVVMVANQFDPGFVRLAISAGVDSFFLATARCEVLIKTLELTILGEQVVPRSLLDTLFDKAPLTSHAENAFSTTEHSSSDPITRKLSPRETVILQSLMKGEPNKAIARKLDVAEATIKVHVKGILRKIGAANRTQAAMWASENLRAMNRPLDN